MSSKRNLAWHFVNETLRDGSAIPQDGKWLIYKGKLEMCVSGLHWSREPFDALQYAPGETLCLVEIGGDVVEPKTEEHTDKGISSKRKIIARMDATELLRYFARMQALSVIHLKEDLPEIVEDYLMTGDEAIRDAARDAAWAAARDAAWDARDVRAAAWSASSAAMAAAWSASSAASSAARDAALAAARDAAWAAAWATARAAARAAAREHFNQLVYESFEDYL